MKIINIKMTTMNELIKKSYNDVTDLIFKFYYELVESEKIAENKKKNTNHINKAMKLINEIIEEKNEFGFGGDFDEIYNGVNVGNRFADNFFNFENYENINYINMINMRRYINFVEDRDNEECEYCGSEFCECEEFEGFDSDEINFESDGEF